MLMEMEKGETEQNSPIPMAPNHHLKAEEMKLISLAIQKLMEEQKIAAPAHGSSFEDCADSDMLLLSKLLSQVEVELMKEKYSQVSAQKTDSAALEMSENGVTEESSRVETEEIVKELKEVKRQNLITHCLVSAMIILTVAWQLSEVSLILKLKDGLSNPFRFIGRFIKKKTISAVQNQIEATELTIPLVNLPDFELNDK